MAWWVTLSLLFAGLLFLMLLGMPVAFAFLGVTAAAMYYFMGGPHGLTQLVLSVFDSLNKFSLTAIPFYILMGEVLYHAGIVRRSLDVFARLVGAIPGRLAIITFFTGGLFAAVSGATVASTAVLATMMVPEMLRRGYSKEMILGPIMAAGTPDIVIPPSALGANSVPKLRSIRLLP